MLAGAFSAQQFLEASKDKGTMTRLLPMSQSHGYKTLICVPSSFPSPALAMSEPSSAILPPQKLP